MTKRYQVMLTLAELDTLQHACLVAEKDSRTKRHWLELEGKTAKSESDIRVQRSFEKDFWAGWNRLFPAWQRAIKYNERQEAMLARVEAWANGR